MLPAAWIARNLLLCGGRMVGKSSLLARLPVIADRKLSYEAAGGADDLRLPGVAVTAIYLRQLTARDFMRALSEQMETPITTIEGF